MLSFLPPRVLFFVAGDSGSPKRRLFQGEASTRRLGGFELGDPKNAPECPTKQQALFWLGRFGVFLL